MALFVFFIKLRWSNIFKKEADDFAVVLPKDFGVVEVGEGEDGQGDGVEEALPFRQSDGELSADSHIIGDFHRFVQSIQRDFWLPSERLKVQSYSS